MPLNLVNKQSINQTLSMKNTTRNLCLNLLLISVLTPFSVSNAAENISLDSLDCAQLYQIASQLEPQGQRQRSIIFNDRSRLVAAAIGTVDNAGFALFGIDLAWVYYDDWRRLSKNRQLDLVRRQMAGRFCFERS